MAGELGILNVGAGDTKLSFDPKKPAEVERAKAAVLDMLKLGYAILVQVGEQDGEPVYRRAKGFDPATAEYVITGAPVVAPPEIVAPADPKPRRRKGKAPETRVKAAKTTAVAVARSAGG